MRFLYDIGIYLYGLLIRMAAFRNAKAKAWVEGRKNIFDQIRDQVDPNQKYVWFHFASLGEFEQGRPVLESLKKEKPSLRIIITFFSPSGYQIRKNYELADHVFYLPEDTRENAVKFIELINPEFAVFTKYEFWYHYFETLNAKKIPLFLIAALFRENQVFFRFYGGLHRKMLSYVNHFFVQDEQSRLLLAGIGINRVSISGDTRFDRVKSNVQLVSELPLINEFRGTSKVFIAGSTWLEDEELLGSLITSYPDWKFIIAPHEVNKERISQLNKRFPASINYSDIHSETPDLNKIKILIIDSIGILSAIYQYGKIAYIGGGFGVGIHNTQEALAFGLPVIFGPEYKKFREARDLLGLGGAKSVRNEEELLNAMNYFQLNPQAGEIARRYVEENSGATEKIMDYLRKEVFS